MVEKFKENGESHRQLMVLIINEIRENREGIGDVNTLLTEGRIKIVANRTSISYLKWVLGILIVASLTYVGLA